MNTIWNFEGISISGIATVSLDQGTVICGTGSKKGIPFDWKAEVNPHGWMVSIISSRGFIGCMQGTTFNLPLEVAAAAKNFTF